jgi:hypothetical protein
MNRSGNGISIQKVSQYLRLEWYDQRNKPWFLVDDMKECEKWIMPAQCTSTSEGRSATMLYFQQAWNIRPRQVIVREEQSVKRAEKMTITGGDNPAKPQ